MTTIETGGPAFPLQSIGPDFAPGYAGMSLRDYFAAKAMNAFVAGLLSDGEPVIKGDYKDIARRAYEIADAMLAARKPDPQQ